MGLFDWAKNRKKENSTPATDTNEVTDSISREEIFRKILEQQAQRSPSERFTTGAVFDISRQNRETFLEILRSNNAMALMQAFRKAYSLFLEHPECVGFNSRMINSNLNDTNPLEWNADIFELNNGVRAALLFMPVHNSDASARIVGILFSENGDEYYYCMLNGDESVSSSVYRNKAMLGIHNIGEVKGRGFELMNSFLDCIKKDFSQIK